MFPDKEFMMMFATKFLSATLAIALLASTVGAVDTVAKGKVKSVNADAQTFVLTDSADKDLTFKLGADVIVNRAGKESKSDLKSGDAINICFEKGAASSTAHYILVQEGTSKNSQLIGGSVKGYDAAKKELTFTNEVKKDSTYPIGKAVVRLNMEDATIENVKTGDHALLIVNTVGGRSTLQSVMVHRVK
jgi:Cu/Ag efflux protein CusF